MHPPQLGVRLHPKGVSAERPHSPSGFALFNISSSRGFLKQFAAQAESGNSLVVRTKGAAGTLRRGVTGRHFTDDSNSHQPWVATSFVASSAQKCQTFDRGSVRHPILHQSLHSGPNALAMLITFAWDETKHLALLLGCAASLSLPHRM